jgi:uncharacterized protein YndB with AHSA1/START domain
MTTTTAGRTGVTIFTTPTDLDVVFTRVVDAPRRIVFRSIHESQARAELARRARRVDDADLRDRFAARRQMAIRLSQSERKEMTLQGSYREVTPPERLVYTDSWGPEWPETVNTMVLTESAGQTTITITMSYPSKQRETPRSRLVQRVDGSELRQARCLAADHAVTAQKNDRVAESLAWLERRGTKRNRDAMLRYGIIAPKAFGVSVATLNNSQNDSAPITSLRWHCGTLDGTRRVCSRRSSTSRRR